MTGILPIDKSEGVSSFGVVAKMRGITRERKAGHAGTLDPIATGVLPVLFGGATRFLDLLPGQQKGYRAHLQLGITTDTLDVSGQVLSRAPITSTLADVESVLPNFTGNIMQVPPMYSALSQDGVRLYELARRGIEVERQSRAIVIERLALVEANPQKGEYVIDVLCSKGTYIRTLIDDIGQVLGCGAVMSALRRTLSTGFSLNDCITLEQAQAIRDADGSFEAHLISVEQAFSCYDAVTITAPQASRFENGGPLDLVRVPAAVAGTDYRVYAPDGYFLGLGEADPEAQQLKVKKLLVKRD